MIARVRIISCLEFSEQLNHRFPIVQQLQPAPDEVGVDVRQVNLAAVQSSGTSEVEEHRAAAQKRFVVVAEVLGVVLAEGGQQLPLAAGPFQERPSMLIPDGASSARGMLIPVGASSARAIWRVRRGGGPAGVEWRSRTHRDGGNEVRF